MVWGIFKITKNLNPEPISKGLELPESHWTSPLGPLAGCCGLGFLNGAKHSLPGSFSAKVGSKHENSQICMKSWEIYISNLVESESANDFVVRHGLGGRLEPRFLTENRDF